mmetsp:Transcript_26319/g.41312  ORF Transcript_26319/g.41312 Transcript_26319/m.41312 type:complete len:150 (+) Transcript_26319:212-661(+)
MDRLRKHYNEPKKMEPKEETALNARTAINLREGMNYHVMEPENHFGMTANPICDNANSRWERGAQLDMARAQQTKQHHASFGRSGGGLHGGNWSSDGNRGGGGIVDPLSIYHFVDNTMSFTSAGVLITLNGATAPFSFVHLVKYHSDRL